MNIYAEKHFGEEVKHFATQERVKKYTLKTGIIGKSTSIFLGMNEDKNNVKITCESNDRYRVWTVNLCKINFCCGVAELGNFNFSFIPEIDDLLIQKAIRVARSWRKGLIKATTTATNELSSSTLERNGFTKTLEFFNPNSGHTVIEYSLFLPKG